MSKRTVRMFVMMAALVLVVIALAACAPAPEAPTTAPQAKSTDTVAAPAATDTTAPTEVPATATTAATAATEATATKAPAPTATAVPFTASIKIMAIYPKQGIQLARVDNPDAKFKLFTTGLNIVPPGLPQYVQAGAIGVAKDSKVDLASATWTIKSKPEGSNATLEPAKADEKTKIPEGAAVFTPDKVGEYVIALTIKDSTGAQSAAGEQQFVVAQYVGSDTCKGCHTDVHDSWAQTGHATFFKEMVDTNGEGEYKDAGFGCARCHTAGYYPVTKESTKGWWDTFVNILKLDPKKDFADKIDPKGKEGTFDSLPAELKSLSNINCESCHGPGGQHVVGDKKTTMAFAPTSATCEQCHNDGHFHIKGEQAANSTHANAGSLTAPNGRAACAQCHSSGGFIDFMDGKATEELRTQVSEVGCSTCHDPHGNGNYAQLRAVGEVKGAAIEIKDAGLSAVCETCHNARNTSESISTDAPEFPHYSTAAEALNNAGGYDFGLKIQDSPHSMMVGKPPAPQLDDKGQPVTGADGKPAMQFGGQAPGSCVYCHMYTTPGGPENATRTEPEVEISDETNPGHNLVGSHSFNMTATRPNGEKVENVAACQSCHSGITSFDLTAKADYDGNGKVEGVQEEVKGLLELVKKAMIDQGAEVLDGHPYFKLPENASTELKGAEYNYRFVLGVVPTGEGRSSAIHNFARSVGLLQASYFKLTGQDVPNATLLYSK